jgi:hypothetical protein
MVRLGLLSLSGNPDNRLLVACEEHEIPTKTRQNEPRRFAKRTCRFYRNTDYAALSRDLAIRTYWADLTKNGKSPTTGAKRKALRASERLLQRLNKPVTETAMQELVQFKRNNPKNTTLEQELKIWKAEGLTSQNLAVIILGIFHRNYARLELTIHVSGKGNKTIPIKEPILRAIRLDEQLSEAQKDELDLMAYSGERRHAINSTPLENVHLIEGTNSAILEIPASLNKTATEHPSIIPKELAERLLDRAQRLEYQTLVPNYQSIWKGITKLAKTKYNVNLTSHYLRKRFETIAERIPSTDMNPNHWVILMGDKPTLGHMPDIYSLSTNTELVQEYEEHLAPGLSLTEETTKPQTDRLAQLQKENQELKEQLLKLTKLLTEKLTEQRQRT